MDVRDSHVTPSPVPATRAPASAAIAVVAVVVAVFAIASAVWLAIGRPASTPPTTHLAYPVGVPDEAEPSGMAPPGPNSLPGYRRSYVSDFTGHALPPGWEVFTGVPGGDPGGQFAANHVVVGNGLLYLKTFKDPKYQDDWVTGGLCQCGLSQTYRAYFVRSRVTGVGPNEVELLWPSSDSWPPEIDFNESGDSVSTTSETVHYGALDNIQQHGLRINLEQWHTWGVIWTAKSIVFVVDGYEWTENHSAYQIPTVPMTLDLEQRTECAIGRQCPSAPVSMQVDWVAEFSPTT